MAKWHLIPILGGIIIGGVAQAQPYQVVPPAASKPALVAGAPLVSGPEGQFMKPGDAPATALPGFGQQPVQLPSPAQPLAGVTLPNQGRGDGAYNGGGVVLEQDAAGVTRQIR